MPPPAIRTSRAARRLAMGDCPHPRRPPNPIHAPRLFATLAVSGSIDSLTSTLSTICLMVCLAGVWGEASPQAPPEARWTVGRSRGASQPWAGGGEERA